MKDPNRTRTGIPNRITDWYGTRTWTPAEIMNRNMPADPFPDWYRFTAAHPLPPADTDGAYRPTLLDDPWLERFLVQESDQVAVS